MFVLSNTMLCAESRVAGWILSCALSHELRAELNVARALDQELRAELNVARALDQELRA